MTTAGPQPTTELSAVCHAHGVARLVLFGSRAQGTARPGSDADVLVQFAGTDGLFDRYFALKASLEALWQCPVDLLPDGPIRNAVLRENIGKSNIVLYES